MREINLVVRERLRGKNGGLRLWPAAAGCMLLAAAPPSADFLKPDIAVPAPVAVPSAAQDINGFYASRQNMPLWLASGAPTPAAAATGPEAIRSTSTTTTRNGADR